MSDHRDKPGTPGDILHYGVKGMRWGVRKSEDGGSDEAKDPKALAAHNSQTKMYLAAAKRIPEPTSPEAAAAIFKGNQEKLAAKFASSEAPVKGPPGQIEKIEPRFTPGQKKAMLYVGGSVAVVGGLYLGSRWLSNNPAAVGKMMGLNPEALANQLHSGKKTMDPAELARLAGKPIDSKQFHSLVGYSQGKTWMGGSGYLTEKAFTRPEFELPAGHTFLRLSTKAEGTFGGPTYCTHSLDDFNRYIAGFRQEKLATEFHRISWKSTRPVKVPNLTTVLSDLHQTLEAEAKNPKSYYFGMKITPETVTKEYNSLSGGGWSTDLAKGLVSRLKSKGYGAIVDEMDAGVIGETPLVFFGTENASPKTSAKLSSAAIKSAESLLKEIGDPPGRKP